MTQDKDTKNPIYRIQNFDRVVDIFEKNELHLSHPSIWDDPYEKYLQHPASDSLFAQCWSTNPQSDAMWRIYSPNHMGLRIRTTPEKLRNAIRSSLKENDLRYRLIDVEYLAEAELRSRTHELTATLRNEFKPELAANSLGWKRRAFKHEEEVRLIIFRDKITENPKDGLKIKIDPHALIDDILIDPRAPKSLFEAFELYLKEKIGFKGGISKSRLYATRESIRVDPDEDPAADL
ncbi:DUF2971 domain-containing protein [Ralstonia pseudosolanacearum]|uniref:DUF2971 domain-containing protein n=1 Tax=Ralstonia solanacearum TaxID=305 RepID=A0A0S4U0Z0_RALSL|nr:conserved protein of unknown function [Ralstonia solanacearum]